MTATPATAAPVDATGHLIDRLHRRLQDERQQQKKNPDAAQQFPTVEDEREWADGLLRQWLHPEMQNLIRDGIDVDLATRDVEDEVVTAVLDRTFGLGLIDQLLRDSNIADIHVMGHEHCMLRMRDGSWRRAPAVARSDDELIRLIQTAAARHGGNIERRFDHANPELNMQLRDGSRLFALRDVIDRPTLVIRKHTDEFGTVEDLIRAGMLSPQGAHLLQTAVRARLNMVIIGATSSGKLEPLDARIPTPTGWTTVGQLRPGDEVFGADGVPVKLLGLTAVRDEPVWTVTFEDGRQVRCGGEHLWEVSAPHPQSPVGDVERDACQRVDDETLSRLEAHVRELPADLYATMPQIAEWGELPVSALRQVVPEALGVDRQPGGARRASEHAPLTVRVYPARESLYRYLQHLRSSWAGDVPLTTVVTTAELAEQVRAASRPRWTVRHGSALNLPDADLPVDPYLLGVWLAGGGDDQGNVPSAAAASDDLMRAAGVAGDRHIPLVYSRASFTQRLALLQGLMDTVGSVTDDGNCSLEMSDGRLADDVLDLIRTLGVKASMNVTRAGHRDTDGGRERRHLICFTTDLPVFQRARTPARAGAMTGHVGQVTVVSVERSDEVVPMRCLYVDAPDHLYLTGDYVPTHNTTLLRTLCAEMPPHEHKVTIEEAREIGLDRDRARHPLVRALETKPADLQGKGEITQQQLVRMSLRMDPDRVILGEVRGGEALQMLTAMTQGQRGSLCTMHGDSAAVAYPRLQLYVKFGNADVPDEDVARLIADAIHFVVFVTKHPVGDGRYLRVVEEIIETRGVNGSRVTYNDVMKRDSGALRAVVKPSERTMPELLKAGFRFQWWASAEEAGA